MSVNYRVGINDWPKLWPYIWYNLCSRHHFSVTKGFLDMIHLCFNPRKVNFSDYGWARGAVSKTQKSEIILQYGKLLQHPVAELHSSFLLPLTEIQDIMLLVRVELLLFPENEPNSFLINGCWDNDSWTISAWLSRCRAYRNWWLSLIFVPL